MGKTNAEQEDLPLTISDALAAQTNGGADIPVRQSLEDTGEDKVLDDDPLEGEELGEEGASEAPPPAAADLEVDPDVAALDSAIAANPVLGVRIKYAQELEQAGDAAASEQVWREVSKMMGAEEPELPAAPPVENSPLAAPVQLDPTKGILELKGMAYANFKELQKVQAVYSKEVAKANKIASDYKECVDEDGLTSKGAAALKMLYEAAGEKLDTMEAQMNVYKSENAFMQETIAPNLELMPWLQPYAGKYAIAVHHKKVDAYADPAVQRQQMEALGYKFGSTKAVQNITGAAVRGMQKKFGGLPGKRGAVGAGSVPAKPGAAVITKTTPAAQVEGKLTRTQMAEYAQYGMRGLQTALASPRIPVKK